MLRLPCCLALRHSISLCCCQPVVSVSWCIVPTPTRRPALAGVCSNWRHHRELDKRRSRPDRSHHPSHVALACGAAAGGGRCAHPGDARDAEQMCTGMSKCLLACPFPAQRPHYVANAGLLYFARSVGQRLQFQMVRPKVLLCCNHPPDLTLHCCRRRDPASYLPHERTMGRGGWVGTRNYELVRAQGQQRLVW